MSAITYCQADWEFFSKIMLPVNSFFKASSAAGIGLPLPGMDDLVQMKKKQKLCKIHLDFAADLSTIMNAAAVVQNVIRLLYACPICSGRLRYSTRLI